MSTYEREIRVKHDHQGESITVRLKALLYPDALMLWSMVGGPGSAGEIDAKVTVAYLEMLPRYVVGIEGATAADGSAITVDDLKAVYWTGLVSMMLKTAMNAAFPSDPTSSGVPSGGA